MAPLVEARGLTKTFTSGDRVLKVLEGLDLAVAEGEMVAVVGASGVGKSTLLHLLGTWLRLCRHGCRRWRKWATAPWPASGTVR